MPARKSRRAAKADDGGAVVEENKKGCASAKATKGSKRKSQPVARTKSSTTKRTKKSPSAAKKKNTKKRPKRTLSSDDDEGEQSEESEEETAEAEAEEEVVVILSDEDDAQQEEEDESEPASPAVKKGSRRRSRKVVNYAESDAEEESEADTEGAAANDDDDDDDDDTSGSRKPKHTVRKPPKKVTKPPKAQTAKQIFLVKERAKIRREAKAAGGSTVSPKEVTAQANARWAAISANDRVRFDELAVKSLERHKAAMDKYEDRLAQYKKDLAAFESGADDKLEWDVQSTVADRKAVAAELVRSNSLESNDSNADGQSIEEIYTKLGELDHILKRPDTFVGSTEQVTEEMTVYDEQLQLLRPKTITYVPGLYKIFDEILVNAADHKTRNPKTVTTVKVTLNLETAEITVWNDGPGIEVAVHKAWDEYVVQGIFGNLRTSSNYNDAEQKLTGGRNGYGAKLTNVFSKSFKVETYDAVSRQKYKQVWRNNMMDRSEPIVKQVSANSRSKGFTKITYTPDLARFGLQRIDSDTEALMKKRLFDLAGTHSGLQVYYNGVALSVKGFKQYTRLVYQGLVIPGIMKDLKIGPGAARGLIMKHFSPLKIKKKQRGAKEEGAASVSRRESASAKMSRRKPNGDGEDDGGGDDDDDDDDDNDDDNDDDHDDDDDDDDDDADDENDNDDDDDGDDNEGRDEIDLSQMSDSQSQFNPEDFSQMSQDNGAEVAAKVKAEEVHGSSAAAAPLAEKAVDEETEEKFVARVKEETRFVYLKVNDRWEIGFAVSPGGPAYPNWPPPVNRQVSFVNGIATTAGGSHVRHVQNQIEKAVLEEMKIKHKGTKIQPVVVRSHICLFINALIVNPAFGSQTKELLTSQIKSFGSRCDFERKQMRQLLNRTGVVDRCFEFVSNKRAAAGSSARKSSVIRGIAKLDDANFAGTRRAEQCTLILTEGDSAKALAISGTSVVGRDRFGVYPLRGKFLNPRDSGVKSEKIASNKCIQDLIKILGLRRHVDYTDEKVFKTLRYGHCMIMADQDNDGSHIKGLVINFLHWYNDSLLKVPGYIQQFITPIVKAVKGSGKNAQRKQFYSNSEYEEWQRQTPDYRKWHTKYYKGLGTSDSREAKEYFRDLERHRINFEAARPKALCGNGLFAGDEEAIEMAFGKLNAGKRKKWMENWETREDTSGIDYGVKAMKYSDFVNKELIEYSIASRTRGIPSFIDGFKPSQRKVLFACFKRRLVREIKVAQLSGYVSEHTAYHHAEGGLASTIIGMAQTFVGSNNINLLRPNGQFGTRLQGGKDAASPRYIFTALHPIARVLFPEDDDAVLQYREDDGLAVEPVFYVPVIPMILVNGAKGIATGWSTDCPSYNPREIIEQIRRHLRGLPLEVIHPYFRGFRGTVEPVWSTDTAGGSSSSSSSSSSGGGGRTGETPTTYECRGSYQFLTDSAGAHDSEDDEDGATTAPTTVVVTELPVGLWTETFKEKLDVLMSGAQEKDDAASSSRRKEARDKARAKAEKAAARQVRAAAKSARVADRKLKKALKDNDEAAIAEAKRLTATAEKAVEAAEEATTKAKSAVPKAKPSGIVIDSVRDNSTETHVKFTIQVKPKAAARYQDDRPAFEKEFRLSSNVSLSNIHLLGERDGIAKFSSPTEILEAFIPIRARLYETRQEFLCNRLSNEHRVLASKAKFIELVLSGELVLQNRPYSDIIADLRRFGIKAKPELVKAWDGGSHANRRLSYAAQASADSDTADDDDDQDTGGSTAGIPAGDDGYSYLLGLPLRALTREMVTTLRAQVRDKKRELNVVRKKTVADMWEADLKRLEAQLDKMDAEYKATLAPPVDKKKKKKKASSSSSRKRKSTPSKQPNKSGGSPAKRKAD